MMSSDFCPCLTQLYPKQTCSCSAASWPLSCGRPMPVPLVFKWNIASCVHAVFFNHLFRFGGWPLCQMKADKDLKVVVFQEVFCYYLSDTLWKKSENVKRSVLNEKWSRLLSCLAWSCPCLQEAQGFNTGSPSLHMSVSLAGWWLSHQGESTKKIYESYLLVSVFYLFI